MRHHRLFAAGFAAALLLGAASPAMANNGKGHGKDNAPGQTKTHPPKGPKPKAYKHLNGGGSTTGGEFSVQVRTDKLRQGHFNFTAADVQVRCRGFEAGDLTFSTTAPATVTFDTVKCVTTRNGVRQDSTMSGTMTDAGNPADTTPPTAGPDSVSLKVMDNVVGGGTVTISGPVTGNIKVH